MLVNLSSSVETIRWDDSGKEYAVSFDDEGIERIVAAVEHVKDIDSAQDAAQLAAGMEAFVTDVAGKECWDDAVAYVDSQRRGAEYCTALLLPLVEALLEIAEKRLGELRLARLSEYLGAEDGVV